MQKHIAFQKSATPAGFEPARGDPIGLAGRRLNHSAKVSYTICIGMIAHQSYVAKTTHIVNTDMGIERACDDLSAGPSIWHCPDMLGLPCGMIDDGGGQFTLQGTELAQGDPLQGEFGKMLFTAINFQQTWRATNL